jgi:thymidylate synthase (FAD)
MTPFEMCEIHVEVKAPIVVFREWHRHRVFSYNEFSARYSVMPNEHYVPASGRIAKQSKANKQSSGEPFTEEEAVEICDRLAKEQEAVYFNYDQLIRAGVANEIARLNTPVSRYSKMRAKTDLRNWLGFLQLRMELNAQKEIREYANAMAAIVKTLYPRTFALFVEHDFLASRFSRSEMELLRKHVLQHGVPAGLEDKKQKAFAAKLTEDRSALFDGVGALQRDEG